MSALVSRCAHVHFFILAICNSAGEFKATSGVFRPFKKKNMLSSYYQSERNIRFDKAKAKSERIIMTCFAYYKLMTNGFLKSINDLAND